MTSLRTHARLPARIALALLAGQRLLEDLPRRWATITRAHRLRAAAPSADGPLPARAAGDGAMRLRAAGRRDPLLDGGSPSRSRAGAGHGERTQWRTAALTRTDGALVVGVVLAVAAVLVSPAERGAGWTPLTVSSRPAPQLQQGGAPRSSVHVEATPARRVGPVLRSSRR